VGQEIISNIDGSGLLLDSIFSGGFDYKLECKGKQNYEW